MLIAHALLSSPRRKNLTQTGIYTYVHLNHAETKPHHLNSGRDPVKVQTVARRFLNLFEVYVKQWLGHLTYKLHGAESFFNSRSTGPRSLWNLKLITVFRTAGFNSMKQAPSEANSRSSTQEILRILWIPMVMNLRSQEPTSNNSTK
jgi:hypothetical protein